MDAWETIKSVAAICAAIAPIIVFLLSLFFSPKEVRSKRKKENLYNLFDNVLLPLTKLLRQKEAKDIDINTIKELDNIFYENVDIIPETMASMHEEILIQFKEKGHLKTCTYKKYKKRIKVTFLSTRDKLGFGRKSYLVELEMLPWILRVILVVTAVLTIFYIEYCFISKMPSYIELSAKSILVYIIIFFAVIMINVFCKWLKPHIMKCTRFLKRIILILTEKLPFLKRCRKKWESLYYKCRHYYIKYITDSNDENDK